MLPTAAHFRQRAVVCALAYPAADTDEIHHRAADIDPVADHFEASLESGALKDACPGVGCDFDTARISVYSCLHDSDLPGDSVRNTV